MDQPTEPALLRRSPALTLFKVDEFTLEIVPGRPDREWMNATAKHFAYRCLPMSIANCSGWEILSPCSFKATWDGGGGKDAIMLTGLDDCPKLGLFAASHFGHGILTFRTGRLFRTSPGWATWVRGAPNYIIDGIQALDGLVETDWLPFTFTVNWRFTRPGSVIFEKQAPLGFVTLLPHGLLDEIQPEIADIADDPALSSDYAAWRRTRAEFNEALLRFEPDVVRQGWQRNYTLGLNHDGQASSRDHVTKRKLRTPRRGRPEDQSGPS